MKGVKTWMTTQWNKDDLFYVCSMIEFVARETHYKVKVCDEWIEEYQIIEGNFDNITTCKYNVPTVTSIGRVYQMLILNVIGLYGNVVEAIKNVYNSFISEEISDFNSSVYYSNPDYIKCSYEAGELLD